MSAFEARYFGTCAWCQERIEPGDMVRYYDDELVHADCGDDDEDEP